MPLIALAVLAFAGGCGAEAKNEPAAGGEPALSDREAARLVDRLRAGGHVVVFRHAATDSAVDLTDDLSDCSRQRNLSAAGRSESREIGAAFRRLRIPFGRVLASPFCRTRDTARLAFGRVRPSRALLSVEFFASEREWRRAGMRRLVSVRPRRGTNTVLVTHGSAIDGAVGVNPEEGDAVIVEPGSREVEATVAAGDWSRLTP